MFVQSVNLSNFRSYEKREFELGKVNVVVGENGSGKSNLIEALYLMGTGKSFRAENDGEMMRYGMQFSVLNAQCLGLELKVELVEGRKKFYVNGVVRLWRDFVGNMRAVMFGPADMNLVTGSPSGRRRYLDLVISQVDREYRRCLVSYEKGLRQRNKLLDLIRDGQAGRNQLFFWDRLVIKNGEYLTVKRQEYLSKTGFEYDKSVISESRIKQYEREEVLAGSTLVGPHRDDFVFMVGGRDVAKYGSRGEQRMAVWWLKQCEIKYLGGVPLLLLDDIFSELDHKHREEVVEFVKNYQGQVVMTVADEHMIPDIPDQHVIRLA